MPVAGTSFTTRTDFVAGYDSLLSVLSRHERHRSPRQRTKWGVHLSKSPPGGKSYSSSPSAFSFSAGRKQDLRTSIVANATTSPPGTVKDLPIFPLQGVVAFPAVSCPLLIFEARYRVLFNTLLSGATDLEEGLINEQSPFCGTRQFGLCWVSKDGAMAKIGTTLQIQSHLRHGDGRLTTDNKGVERFKVLKVKEQKPVMICEVEVLPEDDEITPEVQELAKEVIRLFEGLLELNLKMGRVKRTDILNKWVVDPDTLRPQVLDTLQPNELSYWMASVFQENPLHQQSLLQESSTVERLRQEKEVLSGTVSFLAAKYAVMDALSPKPVESPKLVESSKPEESPKAEENPKPAEIPKPEENPGEKPQEGLPQPVVLTKLHVAAFDTYVLFGGTLNCTARSCLMKSRTSHLRLPSNNLDIVFARVWPFQPLEVQSHVMPRAWLAVPGIARSTLPVPAA